MENKKIKIGIIGSGPNGIAAAIPFLSHKDKFEVTVVSSGKNLFTDEIKQLQKDLNESDRENKHKFWESNLKKNKQKSVVPKKLFFGSNSIYNEITKDIKKKENVDYEISHSLGGLSNVWGANVAPLSKNDITRFSEQDLSKEFSKITKLFPIAGCEDDIDKGSPYNICYNKNSLMYTSQTTKIINMYKNNRDSFLKKNFRVGYSKLAVQTDKNDIDRICENTGLEIYGCSKNSIFNSLFILEEIKKDIILYDNTLVDEIEYKNNSIILKTNHEGEISERVFQKVIIAAGTIGTAKLALKLLNKYEKRSLSIMDSQKYFFLYFTLFKSKKNEEKNTIGLSQIFMQTEIDDHTFHFQLYNSIVLIKNSINTLFSKYISYFILNVFDFFLSRIMIGVVYFPEEISHRMNISYDNDKNSFLIKKLNNPNFSSKYILLIFIKLSKFFLKLKSIPIPYFIRSKVGISQHFGSSLPPSDKYEIGKTNLDGELMPFKNIYISDCSSLSRIPATPPTYLSMSNALRISNNIISKFID